MTAGIRRSAIHGRFSENGIVGQEREFKRYKVIEGYIPRGEAANTRICNF